MERTLQREYWKKHSTVLSVEAMMLDSKASKLDEDERPEILSSLPPIEGKSVVELGAGIGRFTGELAKHAGHVLACDFMEHVIKKNEEINGHYGNIEFICADVTSKDSLKITSASVDIVFSNWLLMYLSDEEVEELAKRMITWVKIGGFIFFRESCFHQSGDHKRKNNPSHYRQPSFYLKRSVWKAFDLFHDAIQLFLFPETALNDLIVKLLMRMNLVLVTVAYYILSKKL